MARQTHMNFVKRVNKSYRVFTQVPGASVTFSSCPAASASRRLRHGLLKSAVAMIVGLSLLGGVPSARAALVPGFGPVGFGVDPGFNGGVGPGQVAVDDLTGNVLAADPGNAQVFVLAPDVSPGGTASVLTQFAVPSAFGVAVDQSTHAVYVSEGPPSNRVERFVSDGAAVPTYTVDPSFVAPVLSNPAANNVLPVAVDPVTHDVLVGDGTQVRRFTSSGALVRSLDGSNTPTGKFHHIYDVTASASGTFVVDYRGEPGAPITGDGITRVLQFDGQGGYVKTISALDTPTVAGFDLTGDRLVTVGRTGQTQNGAQLSTFEDGVVSGVANATVPGGSYISGVAVDGGATRRAYVTVSQLAGGLLIFAYVPAPGVHADSFVTSDPRAAHLTGAVNPEGKATTAHFEYCSERDACAGDPSIAWAVTPDVAVGSGMADVVVSADIVDLSPHTRYRVRIAAVDTQTSDFSNTATVTTADAPPAVSTGPVSDLSSSDATLTGTVTPFGVQSTYYFEYGETTAYGSREPVDASGIAGDGFTARSVSRQVTGLKPGTVYHYRVVGVNSTGSTPGADRTLTTTAAGTVARGYELVTPVDKQGIGVDTGFAGARSSLDGNALMYGTAKSPLPGSQTAVFVPRVLGTRTATGWTASALEAPLDNLEGGHLLYFGTLAVSADVQRALVLSNRVLGPGGAVQGGWNLYIRQPGASPEYTFVASDPLLGVLSSENSPFRLVGVSDDLSHTVFTDNTQMYEAVVGIGVRLVSRMPDNSPAGNPVPIPSGVFNDAHQVSIDGSRIYFSTGPGSGVGPLYLRQDGTTTVPISVSHRPAASSTPVQAQFIGASPDGRYVEFSTACGCAVDGLTPSAPDGPGLYRYDVVSGGMTYLAPDANNTSANVPRPERNAIVFENGAYELYYAQGGTATKIATLDDYAGIVRGSDSGRYYVFATTTKLTSYDNAGHLEVYLYDADTADLSCASCRNDGGTGSSSVQLAAPATNETILARYKPRVVLDDGTVFFDTTDPLVGADVNGTRDVYAYRSGRASLISRGTLPTSSQFVEATPDGSDVFFSTNDQLVDQDKDTIIDMYDARVGGGFSPPNPGPVPCAGSECREAGSGPVTSDAPPSAKADPTPSTPAAGGKARVTVVGSSATGSTLRLVVQVSGPGRIGVSGARVQSTSRTVVKAGKYTLKVPLTRKTRSARKAHHKVKVAVKVTLTPPFAAMATAKFSRTLGK
jgi:hypothetical protein